MAYNLYRAKTLEGDWKQGYFVKHDLDTDDFYSRLSQVLSKPLIAGLCRRLAYMPKGVHSKGTECCELNERTLGRYTGYLDIDGEQIFDGDIVEVYINGEPMSVLKNGQKVPYNVLVNTECTFGTPFGKGFLSMCKFRIIGNIYDNHELLLD